MAITGDEFSLMMSIGSEVNLHAARKADMLVYNTKLQTTLTH
jgi:hypothetical protein